MRMSNIPSLLKSAHKANISVFLKSPPGIGKTSIVRQYAKEAKMRLIAVHAPLTDPLDIKGLPTVEGNEAKFLPLNIWPQETDEPVVVLIDELPQCVPSIQNAYSQLLIDKQLGNVTLPKGSLVVATGNRREDKAATSNIPSHIVNRVMHVTVDTHTEDFLDWALENGIDPSIVAFGRFRPDSLHNFDPRNSQEPYATYRTWEMASHFIKHCDNNAVLMEALNGLVGEGAATEYMAFRRMYQELPDPKEVLAHPSLAVIPHEPATMYALTTACASIVTEELSDNLFILARRLPAEYAVMMIKTALKVLPKVAKCKEYGKWAMENKSLIL